MFSTSFLVLSLLVPFASGTPDIPRPTAKADLKGELTTFDLSGYYICEGNEGPGKQYKGIAVITKKNDVYVVQWVIGTSPSYAGDGLRTDNTFSAGWALTLGEKNSLIRGVNTYRIETGPRLVGRWATVPGDGTIRTETLTFLKKLEQDD
jgi:hypothetical protein